jgi:small subunit ribosomal protein S12e
MDMMTALQQILKDSLASDGLARGLKEVTQAIEKRNAQLCVLAQDCDQPDYIKLIKALCNEANVQLISVPKAKQLGEWVGLCKLDEEGNARKVVACSSAVVKDLGEGDSEALSVIRNSISANS